MSEKKTVVVASNNAHKIEEIRAILGAVLPDAEFKAMGEIGGLPEPEETGTTFEENAFIKAQTIHDLTGLPTVAECGGFLYLGQSLEDANGERWPMAGVLPGQGFRVGRLVRFGYATLTAHADSMLFRAGERLPVHEFHHWDSTDNGTGFTAAKPNGKQWDCGFANEHFYAGFPHLYWAGTALPRRFVDAAAHYHQEEQDQ